MMIRFQPPGSALRPSGMGFATPPEHEPVVVPDFERRTGSEAARSLRTDDGGEVVFLRELGEHFGGTCRMLIHQYAGPL
jgi:hypothetical protein